MRNVHQEKFGKTGDKTKIVGILNVTPDSFSDGGTYFSIEAAVRHAKQMVQDGADIIDIGGESTRPKSEPISVEEEMKRVRPVVQRLVQEVSVPLSIDTRKPEVAKECLRLGVRMMNDVTGLGDRGMREIAAEHKVPVVIMHMQGTPETMQENPVYEDVVKDIDGFFEERIVQACAAGVERVNIILDPGIGFGKTTRHNLEILSRLREFLHFGLPLMVGPSRKGFIENITGLPVGERLPGTLMAVAFAVVNGASFVRVHDVKECKKLCEKLMKELHS